METMNEAGSADQKTNKESKTKTREEGELSSSDDDANPGSPFAHTSGAVAHSAATDFATPANKHIQGTQMVKTISSSVDIEPQTSVKPNSLKSFEQKRVTFKSNNPGWFPSSGTNANLVISFSDDESGSDTEDHRHKKAFQNKSSATGVDDNGRPPTSSVVKSKNLRQSGRNISKVIPNKISPSYAFVSSTNRILGGANSWVSRPLSVEQRSRVRNFNINKNFGSQERASDQGVDLRNSKLQDLRQQIALRENELKLKAAQQSKDLAVDSGENHHAMNLSNDATRKYQSTSTNVGRLEQKEPDKKRLKLSGSYSQQLTADGRQNMHAPKSIVPAKEQTLQKSTLHDRNKLDHYHKNIPISRIGTNIVEQEKQGGKQVGVLPENVLSVVKDVANINTSRNQSDRDSRHVNTDLLLNGNAQLANVTSSNLPKNFDRIESNHTSEIGVHHLSSILNKATREQNVVEGSDYSKAISRDRTVEPSFNNMHQVNDIGLWNCFGNGNVSGHSNMHIQSLFDMEDLLDKELEEAQEHRRICEIEERNALKAYRKAQRALVEANVRCTKLYCQREECSVRFRSLIMDDSNLLWPSRQHEPVGNELDLSKHISENMNLLPTPSHQTQSGFVGFSQGGYDSSIQCVSGAPLNSSHEHANAQNLGSEPCSEPDASASEMLPLKSKNAGNRLSPHSNELNISADEDEEIYQLGHESVKRNFGYLQKDQIYEGRQIGAINKKLSTDSSQDPLLLEATLRSELFARLGMRTLSKNSDSCFHVEPSVDRGADNDSGSDKMQMSNSSVPSSGGQNQQHDIGGTDEAERSIREAPVQIQAHVEKSNLKFHSTSDCRANKVSIKEKQSALSILFSPLSVLRSAFGHLERVPDIALANQVGNQENLTRNFAIELGACVKSNETQDSNLISKSNMEAVNGYFERHIGSYTYNLAVDPFWPLCMYDLRGKCNNDECPWQHVKNFSDGNMYEHDNSDGAGCEIGSTIHCESLTDMAKISKCHNIMTPPTYIVGLDILKAESHSFESVVARRHEQCWQKFFSISLALSSLFQKDLPAEFLHATDGRIEWHESWNGQSSYFRSRNGIMLKQTVVSSEQSVEMALLILNQEANKLKSTKKALSLLSRALEADPTSELLWIIYLIIFYSNINSIGKDDMFSYAVKHNEGSYGLWLMYINSRIQLNNRLAAYDAALSALCCHPAASEGDEIHASACVLDLFLQMMECLCMSGNIEKAIQRLSGLFLTANDSIDHHSMLLSDILTYLTISDKLIFLVCCAYLVIYRKLPDAVLQQFECEKELLAIEWTSVHVGDDEKQRAVKLIEMAADSVEKYINNESLKSEIILRSVQNFAVNHIRCMVALDGLECCRNLLEKYMKLYPYCLELVLLLARLQKHDFGDLSFVGFEEALSKWPKGVPGIQCIWNQYAEYALQNGRSGFAAELMDRWFHSVWKSECCQVEISDPIVADTLNDPPESTSASNPDFSVSSKNQIDLMFGYLNLSLHKLLQNNCNEAHLAIEEALKAAAPDKFKHCVREHAMLLLIDESEVKEDALTRWQLRLLNSYLDKAQSFSHFEPLSREFINKIEMPRVRQLITNLLSPISSDFSLINLVLEVWYGPSLLPKKFSKLKDLVDFVEAIMEIVPSNYQLAFSVFKLLNGDCCPTDTDVIPASVLFWASSTMVSAIFHAVPIAPEYIWAEAAGILGSMTGIEAISERFYKRALYVYPFSIKLWKCFYNLSQTKGDTETVIKAAREKGIELD